jgi:acyl carrier protein
VAAGIAGEIFLAGAGLARGYFGRPDLTAERFLPDPLSATPGGRLYRTGDRSRLRPDGRLEILGRADHQIKIRGCRIEPGEIEAVLLRHPAAGGAVVLPREEAPGDVRLVAYVEAGIKTPGSPSRREAMRSLCRAHLPPYMIPSTFVLLAALPLTANGKVDRAALPGSPTHPEDTSAYAVPPTPPRSALEKALAEIWKETLGVESVGLHDGFFDLGGHSLLLFRVQGLLRERLGRSVSPLDLLRHTTVSALARHLVKKDGAAAPPVPGVLPGVLPPTSETSLRDEVRGGGRDALAEQLRSRRAARGAVVGGVR